MRPILEIQNISKKFRIHHRGLPYLSLREKLSGLFKATEKVEEFWALKDVSFDILPGESVGIIGKNGAGKSTLLKILSKITPPTSGKIIARGKVASLLEVGTGFHQELTGRENIFMNGAILGMSRGEIRRRFDDIVDFSGVEKFLDTPLKHYSSGMQLRLAFAVAANLEPEILIVDEVLAVGDAEFQKKCMGKMQDVRESGRTIVFVSHNLDAVEALCKRSLLFAGGKLIEEGLSENLIRNYLAKQDVTAFRHVQLSASAILEEFALSAASITSGSPLGFSFKIKKSPEVMLDMTDLCLLFYNYKKQRVAIYDLRKFFKDFNYTSDTITFEGKINSFNLIEGYYGVGLYYGIETTKRDLYDLAAVELKSNNYNSPFKPYDSQYRGFVELI